MIYFLSLQLTYKNSILYYKVVKVTINVLDFVEVISNMIVCYHNHSNLAIAMKAFFNIVVCHHDFLCSIVINSNALYFFKTYNCYTIFQPLDIAILPHSISKSATLSKGQIAASREYF